MKKFIIKLVIILMLVCLFGSLAFYFPAKILYWIGNWLESTGFEPFIKIGGG